MSSFDLRQDAPGLLRAEALNITLKFERTSATTGRISWNIPTPAAGCTAENQAYCGMLVTIDTTPASASKTPTNGEVYESDATADANLFAGSHIGTSLVIGAFYTDRTTTFFDVTGLMPNTPYYVSGFPMDCQYRYFIEGVHAYSLEFKNRGTDGTHGSQVVVLNAGSTPMGVQPTDYTGLAPTVEYDFTVQLGIDPIPNRPIDSVECTLEARPYNVRINGTNASTYAELVSAINTQFALLSKPQQGPAAANTGAYYWNASQQKLFQWDGSQHVEVPVLIDDSTPNNVTVGTYWLNPSTNVLQRWNGSAWVSTTVIEYGTDPTAPIADSSYWYDGSNVYIWNGNTWCQVTNFAQTVDPSLPVLPPAGSYWYDDANGVLYKWNVTLEMWEVTTAIQYHEDPNTLTPGTYWFNEAVNALYAYNGPTLGWTNLPNTVVSELEPTTPTNGQFWYNPLEQELFTYTGTTWTQLDVLVFPSDPTVRAVCDLWWNTATDVMSVWDGINGVWVVVTQFYQQPTDPSLSPTMNTGYTWFNPTTQELYVWENNCFVVVDYINWATDPTTTIPAGTIWHNTTANTWLERGVGAWTLADPIVSPSDPTSLPTGTFWFNTTNSGLQLWNGISWVTVTYSTVPLTPATGTLWFDTNANTLKVWTTSGWDNAPLPVTVELDCNGNLLFTDATVGSTSLVRITDGTLFKSLDTVFAIHDATIGSDGASSEPSYAEVGIGTDGSIAIRAKLANDMRYDLGYPVVDVELTQEQMDHAIDVALMEFRTRSGMAYKRGFFFMGTKPNEQRYQLASKVAGHNKIVEVLGVYRMTSSFLSSAHGAGVYGQIVLQHLYNMGTFDLLSYHIMGEYTKLLEMLFAGRLTFHWNEQTRELFIHHRFPMQERTMCIEASVERTEQDLMTDRYARSWIRRWALAQCRMMLAETRGKFSTLPGAGGGVTLNASDLRSQAMTDMEACIAEIDDYVVDGPDEWGMGSQFTFG